MKKAESKGAFGAMVWYGVINIGLQEGDTDQHGELERFFRKQIEQLGRQPVTTVISRCKKRQFSYCCLLDSGRNGEALTRKAIRKHIKKAIKRAKEINPDAWSGQGMFDYVNPLAPAAFAERLEKWVEDSGVDSLDRDAYRKALTPLLHVPRSPVDSTVTNMLWSLFPEEYMNTDPFSNEYTEGDADGRELMAPARSLDPFDDDSDDVEAARVLATAGQLAGAAEFKAYLAELEAMRPYLARWKKTPFYPTQHLLFAVDAGAGCTTAAELLGDYLDATGLYGLSSDRHDRFTTDEIHFRYTNNPAIDMDAVLDNTARDIRGEAPGLVVIHIETWLTQLETVPFQRFLESCWQCRDEVVMVFVVPFLDESTLGRVHTRLNDILNVRLIRFPPFTDQELLLAARNGLQQYGIAWDASSDAVFLHAITLERSFQQFYGMQTVRRLVTELVLMKVRNSAQGLYGTPQGVLMEKDFTGWRVEDSEAASGFEQLDALIGLENVKKRVREIVMAVKAEKRLYEAGQVPVRPSYHMLFTGNPGTGKTMVARIVGRIFRENGLLPVGDLLEVSRFDLVGEFIGHTGPKTIAMCRSAKGSVMFVDEAYLLYTGEKNGQDFGREALGALIAEMENNRDKFVVIFAGYADEMEEMLKGNAGMRDRIPHRLHFASYSREELLAIFRMQVNAKFEAEEAFWTAAKAFFDELPDTLLESREFGNGRFVRNIVERVRIKAMLRLMGDEDSFTARILLLATDFENAVSDEDIAGMNRKEKPARIGFS